MSEFPSARKSSVLAISESKTSIQKNGGCVGIFFQLLDWNRKFAKKRLFPKKLLPPARTSVSKKFNADEKLPVTRHLLIEGENFGGFPSKMKTKNGDYAVGFEHEKHEMQAPGLVARLMGLEAMPIAADKSGGSFSEGELKNMELSPEKVNVRPQKLQKTGASERRPVTRFGAEALQIKSVLSRSRKNHCHHPKLVPPVKSPKMGRNGSRLIDAAARILEPGIQATNRARCSLSYTSSSIMQTNEEGLMNEVRNRVDSQSHYSPNSSEVQVSNAQGGRSSGNVFGRVDMVSIAEQNQRYFDVPVCNLEERFCWGLDENKPKPTVYLENENDVVLLKTRYRPEESRLPQNNMILNGMDSSQNHEEIPVSRIFMSQKDTSRSTVGVKSKVQRSGPMLVGNRVPPKSKLQNTHSRRVSSPANAIAEPKDFIALNRNVSQSRLRAPSKPDIRFEANRKFQTGKNDSPAPQRDPIRKRRTLPANRQADIAASTSSSIENRRNEKELVATGNGQRGPRNSTTNVSHSSLKNRSDGQRGNKDTSSTDVVSFTFNSPVKSSYGRKPLNEARARRRDVIGSINEKSIMENEGIKQHSHNNLGINEDALGALLEQKLKELTHQVENEAATGFMPSSRTTASILQELIAALTTEQPKSHDEMDHALDRKDSECNDIVDVISQADTRDKRSPNELSCGVDHFSPGCILDASFSNESCISSSIDDNSVKLAPDFADLSDSASSTNQPQRSDITAVTDLVTHTSAVLQDVNFVHAKLTPTKRDYMQDIILNAELLFGNAGVHSSSRFIDFLIGPFLDELETLVLAAWKNSIIVGIDVRKEENPLRRFLLDCLIECLDVRYSRYINSGFRIWSKLPKTINAEVLIKEFDEEVRKWVSFSGKTRDEIIEMEMSTSLGKWTDFEIEAFESGLEINQDIVHILVDEIVTDLCTSELSFC